MKKLNRHKMIEHINKIYFPFLFLNAKAIGIKESPIIHSIIIAYFLILRIIKYSTSRDNTPIKAGFDCVQIASSVNVPVLL